MTSKFAALPYIERIGPARQKGEKTYMIRLHLTPWRWWKLPRLYLHILGRPDEDREFHDHPWGFTTLVLWGGYTEYSHELDYRPFDEHGERPTPTGKIVADCLGFLSVRKRPAEHAHNIVELHAPRVVTLVMRDNKRGREWGFWKEVWKTLKLKGTARRPEIAEDIPVSSGGAGMKTYEWVNYRDYLGLGPQDYEAY